MQNTNNQLISKFETFISKASNSFSKEKNIDINNYNHEISFRLLPLKCSIESVKMCSFKVFKNKDAAYEVMSKQDIITGNVDCYYFEILVPSGVDYVWEMTEDIEHLACPDLPATDFVDQL